MHDKMRAMNKLSIKAKLLLLSLFLSLLVVVVGWIGLHNAAKSNSHLETVYKDRVVCLRQLKVVSDMYAVNIVDAAHKARNGNISTAEALNLIHIAQENIRIEWDAYRSTSQTEDENRLIKHLNPVMANADEAMVDLRKVLSQNDIQGISDFTIHKLYPVIDPVTQKISSLIDLQLAVAKQQYETAHDSYESARAIAIRIIIIGILLAAILSFALMRSISGPIRMVRSRLQELATGEADLSRRLPVRSQDEIGQLSAGFNTFVDKLSVIVKQVQTSGIDVNSSTTTIGAFTKDLEAAVNQQLASSNEVVATAGQISNTSQELANTMNEVTAMLQRTAEFANQGRDGLTRMEGAIQQMVDATNSIAGRLTAIDAKAQSINTVVSTIRKVATQTQLLSFNAAIEAEKAGEFGRGFSVVAAEIRKLSDQTGVATLEIGNTIKEMTSAVSAGVANMDQFKQQVQQTVDEVKSVSSLLAQIIERVQSLAPQFQAVTHGMQSQSIAAEQIRDAMVELRDAAYHTSKSLKESVQMIGQLNRASQGLYKEVGRFKMN